MTEDRFPVPFGGITHLYGFDSEVELSFIVDKLIHDGHVHNFAIQVDGLYLWGSELAMECIERILDEGQPPVTE